MITRPTIRTYMSQKCQEVLRQKVRNKVLYGGRGGQKSWAVADYLISKTSQGVYRVLCTREMQNSIKDSVYRLLCDRIFALGLDKYFIIQKEGIRSLTGSEFLFKGLRSNIGEIKSTEGIDICWVEEAGKVSVESWDILIPTIRKEDSEIIITFNPDLETDPVYQRFVLNTPPDTAIAKVGYADNLYFPEVLRKEMEYCKKVDFEAYENIWAGNCKNYGNAVIFKNKFVVEEFEAQDLQEFLLGADWGYANDPTTLVRMYIIDKVLYIDYEAYSLGIEINDIPTFFGSVPQSKMFVIRADSARPDTISYVSDNGYPKIEAAEKGKNSIVEGIQFIRGFEKVVIHPRCKHVIEEFNNYRWKTNKITKEILSIPEDKMNHTIDAIRYALEPYMKNKQSEIKVADWDFIQRR